MSGLKIAEDYFVITVSEVGLSIKIFVMLSHLLGYTLLISTDDQLKGIDEN